MPVLLSIAGIITPLDNIVFVQFRIIQQYLFGAYSLPAYHKLITSVAFNLCMFKYGSSSVDCAAPAVHTSDYFGQHVMTAFITM